MDSLKKKKKKKNKTQYTEINGWCNQTLIDVERKKPNQKKKKPNPIYWNQKPMNDNNQRTKIGPQTQALEWQNTSD